MDIFKKPKPKLELGLEFKDKTKKYYEEKLENIKHDIDTLSHNLDFSKAMLEVVEKRLKEL
jgi:hypothetical protein